MFRFPYVLGFAVIVLFLGMVIGCSDDDDTVSPGSQTGQLELIDLTELIENVAPPEYTAPTAAPGLIDSVWFYGQTPLLEVVFGAHYPPALYSNIDGFKMNMDIITNVMEVDENGDPIAGVYADSHMVEIGDQEFMLNFTATVTALSAMTTIPAEVQEVFGTEFDIDYLIEVETEDMPDAVINIGMTLSDSAQTFFQYDENCGDPTDTQSRLIYANLDPRDSSFVFKGVGYCLHSGGELYSYAFSITSENNSDFGYRASWYSNGSEDTDLLNCILGGGNKDEEFALKYRVFVPADTNVVDSMNMLDQVFGPNYSEGTGLITDYAEYLDEELIFTYDVVPMEMLTNPWAEK